MEAFDASGRTVQQKLMELQQLVEDEATGVGFNHQLSVGYGGISSSKMLLLSHFQGDEDP